MFRLIILLLPIAVLIVIAVQNSTLIALNFLGGSFPAVPFGLLLAITVCIGALITLLLYGLVGWRRPPESKYRPMGRRVPYPDSDPSSLPSNPTVAPSSYPPTDAYGGYASDAFVSDTPIGETAVEGDRPPIPQDSPRDIYHSSTAQSSTAEVNESQSNLNPLSGSTFVDSLKSNLPFTKKGSAPEGMVSESSGGKGRASRKQEDGRPIGDDWGERRTVEQINDWEAIKPSVVEEGIDNLFRFSKNAGTNVGRIADDIASGWNNQNEGYYPSAEAPKSYPESYYAEPYGDELEHGWENFDDGYDDLEQTGSAQPSSKRIYGDSLYGRGEPPWAEDDYLPEEDDIDLDRATDEVGPDGVYEADYKVIIPPLKPLDEVEDDRYS
ncbi:hypothetical protein S7335_3956 [Synechococcus sp. PCC 7335]|uniref:LapA family protein n=1 Tax=Synechococcus sp. (strain ATCC 29403 / PCC 7335) TaxID=91464 RepID=UPI00017EE0CB|nr:LapA family protein [Synechococcus sp. PCC 7335]EDX86253.1 hypothetical protein S7335_3956 [Synechococcus sp. PCC 7335]